MTRDPQSPAYDPEDDPHVSTMADAPGDLPNELPPETGTITFHRRLERDATLLLVASFLVVVVGGVVEIAPLFWLENTVEAVEGLRPYSPLELAGRDVYAREGCCVGHGQMVRPMRDEVERHGRCGLATESMDDHPFRWGSERTGPDLARIGGRHGDEWHVDHLMDPQSVVPESVMPRCAFLADTPIDGALIGREMAVHRLVGVPYTDEMIAVARADVRVRADSDGDWDALPERCPGAQARTFDALPGTTEMDALVAHFQMLGTLVDFFTFDPDPNR